MRKAASKRHKEQGFTLLEMAIVIIIGGILLSFLGSALLAYMKKNRIITTEFRIERIEEALDQFLRVNGHYPCPASRFLGPENAQFGRMVTSTCNAGSHSGTVRNGGVRIGAVPTRSLNLPDDFAADAWGRKFTYAVTEDLATTLQFTADGGVIRVIDGAGNPVGNPPNTAHYVIISHGTSGDGGFPLTAATIASPACTPNSLDRENCDNDNTFRVTLVNSDSDTSRFYDDYAFYKGQTVSVLDFPPNSVLLFNSPACPTGWRLLPDSVGRFLVGAAIVPPYRVTRDTYQMSLADPLTVPPFDMNLSQGTSSAGDSEAIVPPYFTLTACEKI